MRYTFLDKREDNAVYFVGGKLEIYIPKMYFEEEISVENGMKISTLGIFAMKYYEKPDDTKSVVYHFDLPETIYFTYSECRTEATEIKGVPDTYRIFTLYKEDIFITNTRAAKNAKNTEKFVKLHQGGKIPNTVEYSTIIKFYLENMFANNANLKVPASILEMMIGELARDKNNINIPFRKKIGSDPNVSELDYIQVTIKQLAMINSTFTAITSEDINQALQAGISKSRTNGLETETPMEKTIKY